MSYIDDIIIDSCRLSEFKILVLAREGWKAKKSADQLWTDLRNYNIDKPVKAAFKFPIAELCEVTFFNDSKVVFTSFEIIGGVKGFRFDQVYSFKGDSLTPKEKIQHLVPYISSNIPRIPISDRFIEV